MRSNSRRGAPRRCSPFGSRKSKEKEKLIKRKGEGLDVCSPGLEGLKITYEVFSITRQVSEMIKLNACLDKEKLYFKSS